MTRPQPRLADSDPPAAEILSRLGPKSPAFGAVGRGTGESLTAQDVAHALGSAKERLGAAIAGVRFGGLQPDWHRMEALCQRRCDLLAERHDWPDMPTWRRNEMALMALEEVTFTMPRCGVCRGKGERQIGERFEVDPERRESKKVPVMGTCPSCGGVGKWSLNDHKRARRIRTGKKEWCERYSRPYQALLDDLVQSVSNAVCELKAALR